jgi:hypothetical protein
MDNVFFVVRPVAVGDQPGRLIVVTEAELARLPAVEICSHRLQSRAEAESLILELQGRSAAA